MNCDHCGDPLRVDSHGFFISTADGSRFCAVSPRGHALDGVTKK